MSADATILALARSVTQNTSDDAFTPILNRQQWDILGSYMRFFELAAGSPLIDKGEIDRTLFFVESGSLSVHVMNNAGQLRMIVLTPGAVVGEGAFFSWLPRGATVTAKEACRIWSMTAIRFLDMTQHHPALALTITLALGGVIARRMANGPKRVAVT